MVTVTKVNTTIQQSLQLSSAPPRWRGQQEREGGTTTALTGSQRGLEDHDICFCIKFKGIKIKPQK